MKTKNVAYAVTQGRMKEFARTALTACFTFISFVSCAITTTQLTGDTLFVTVPEGETYTLLESDMVAVGDSNNICKLGEGMLILSTNESAILESAYKNWTGKMIASNGCLRLDTDYVLGKYNAKGGGDTYIEQGASLIVNYSRIESVDKTTGGWIQNEVVHLKGNGYQGQGALYQTIASHITLGTLFLEGDAWIGKKDYNNVATQYRYKTIDFNGQELHASSNSYFMTADLSFRGVENSKLIVEAGARWAVSGTISSGNILTTQLGNGSIVEVGKISAAIPSDLLIPEGATPILYINGVASKSAITNSLGGKVLLEGNLRVDFADNTYSCALTNEIQGAGALDIRGGCLTIGGNAHCFRSLRFGIRNSTLGSIELPADYLLTVQSLETNGVSLAAGEYDSSELSCIVSGRVKVDPDYEVYGSSASTDDVDVRMRSNSLLSSCSSQEGRVSINAYGSSSVYIADKALEALLGRARTRLDATATDTISYHDTWESPSGSRGITAWRSCNGNGYEAKQWPNITPELPTERRYVRAYTTIQEHTVNGLARPYVDFGEEDGGDGKWDTNLSASNETASAMAVSPGTLHGREFHIVHADAHPNTGGKAYRNVLGFGRTNQQSSGNTYPGRRSPEGMLFYQGASYAAAGCYGKIWVDNVMTNSTFVPEWDDVNVYTILPTNAFEGATSDFEFYDALGSDSYGRYGGMRIGEILVYYGATNTASEREMIDAYLLKKWKNVGVGSIIPLGDVRLDDATLSFESDQSGIGCAYRISSISGAGALNISERDVLQAETLVFDFERRDTCSMIEANATLDLGLKGILKIRSDFPPKRGEYVLVRAREIINGESLRNWTVDLSECEIDPALARIRVEGNEIVLEVRPNGFLLFVR